MVTNPQGGGDERVVRCGYPHNGRSGDAGPLPARPRSHCRNLGRRPFLRLSVGAMLCRCPGAMSQDLERSIRTTMDLRGGYQRMLRERILILLLKTQLLDLAGPELLEQGDRPGTIGKQVEARVGIEGDLDCTIVNPIIDPVRLDP